jgi:tetratricopeptide (TPR) repeat protein
MENLIGEPEIQFDVPMRRTRFRRMRSVFTVLLTGSIVAAAFAASLTPANAQAQDAPFTKILPGPPEKSGPKKSTRAEPPKPEPAKPELTHEQKLNELFAQLKRERNEKAAQRISSRIWQEWNNSGSSSVDLMMGWAKSAMDDKKYDVALDFLDQVVTLDPKYPEGWNRRATLHFMMHNFGKSMADIEQTLELEPRHFGALAGMAQIMQNRERKELALQAYQRILDIYPMDRNAQSQVSTIAEDLAGDAI